MKLGNLAGAIGGVPEGVRQLPSPRQLQNCISQRFGFFGTFKSEKVVKGKKEGILLLPEKG
jgi:hypothetical protein